MAKTLRPPVPQLLAFALLAVVSRAHGQVDVNPPRPNVLLLVDSSGSMEYKTGETKEPTCVATGTGSETSRWIDLVQVLTGKIKDYRCEAIRRNSSQFQTEYKIAGANPADRLNPRDYLYPLAYHRPQSGTCAPTPGSTNETVGFCNRTASKPCGFGASDKCDFVESEPGLMDTFASEIRFGLMTFDTLPDASKDMDGTWSYIYGNRAVGAPLGCTAVSDQEVGARNATAPMWEGRMMAFGPHASDNEVDMLRTRNEAIQKILIATRPFGATPIAGMLRDAQDFFWNDPNPDGSGNKAPKDDPFNTGKCRDNFIILLTDGEPNMDLRPFCQGLNPVCGTATDACCPFKKPEDIAWALANDKTNPIVKTFVVGFSVSTATTDLGVAQPCDKLDTAALTSPTGMCATNKSSSLQICCTLSRIAYNGGTSHAYFASSVEELNSSLSTILSEASKGTTSRTFPVFASGASSSSGSTSFRFFTSFVPKIDGSGLWQGVIDRQRFVCDGTASAPQAKAIDKNAGDDFVANVNFANAGERHFYSVIGDAVGTAIHSTRTIRPQATAATLSDGAGSYKGSQVTGDVNAFPTNVPAAAMTISDSPCMKPPLESGMDATGCRNRYLKWLVGGNNGTKYQRCATVGAADCNLVADVFHSVPAIVGSPRESLRDEGYQQFSLGDAKKRPIVLYTSTNDGFLHALKVASNDSADDTDAKKVLAKANNELWAFIPPAVLPRIPGEYPNVHRQLLDGAPVVRDVAGTKTTSGLGFVLERNLKTIAGPTATWRTVLVQSFGGAYPGYFALDVTDPAVGGPKFLWQLTTDEAGNPLFGESGGTPTIATLFFDPVNNGDGKNPLEIPVAILPGGNGGTPPSTKSTDPGCPRADPNPSGFDTTTQPRTRVPCYTDDAASDRAAARRARSLTIVRLDTGEIIRTFRRSTVDAPASIASRVTASDQSDPHNSPLDSPITGQPVAYPGWTGSIADRAYVGDRDGTLWRLDLSSTDPTKWTMKLFFDAYAGKSWYDGQPVATTPIVSTNENGQVVVLFSTGSQEDLIGTTGTENFVYSLYESAENAYAATVKTKVNWYELFTGGKRVAGPLTLFDSNVYFSTYTPPVESHACDSGASSIWGMHFVTPSDTGDLSKGGKAALPKDGVATATERVQEIVPDDKLIAKGSTIFGVGVAEIQSCYTTGDAITDPYFGTSYAPITGSSATQYQLVVQTGKAGSSAASGSTTNSATINLPQPNVSPRINSWALVME